MTPCEKLGYKVGDRFEVINTEYVTGNCIAGDTIILHRDDGTISPFFRKEGSDWEGDYAYLPSLRPLKNTLKTGDTIERDGKKYRVTLEEIPQYDFKPGMLCRVIWDGSEYCSMHSGCTRVVYIENSSTGREMVSYACEGGDLAIGFVNTSSLRPE